MRPPEINASSALPGLVSVVIPAYNAARFIVATIESVLAQTYPTFEIVVVDDGSQDDTAAIVESLVLRDTRIRLIRQSNRGGGAARNAAIMASTGEFIAPLDADDIWLPGKLEEQVKALRDNPDAGMVYCWSFTFGDEGEFLGGLQTGRARGHIYEFLILDNVTGNGSVQMYRRHAIARVGSFDDRIGGTDDYDLVLRVAEHYEIEVVPQLLVGYRQSSSSVSRNTEALLRSYERVIAEVIRRDPQVDSTILRWSRANFLAYLAGQAYGVHNDRQALRYLFASVRADPTLLVNSWPARMIWGCYRRMRQTTDRAPAPVRPSGPLGAPTCAPPVEQVQHATRATTWWKPSNLREAYQSKTAMSASRRRHQRPATRLR